MITRVYGKVDGGNTIYFTYNSDNNTWQYIVPANMTGQYILQLWAVDEAQNIGYYGKILFTIDLSKLCVKIKWLDNKAKVFLKEMGIQAEKGYDFKVIQTEYDDKVYINKFIAKIVRCELCGRY